MQEQEDIIYQKINSLLNQYDFSIPPQEQQNLFDQIQDLHNDLITLEEKNIPFNQLIIPEIFDLKNLLPKDIDHIKLMLLKITSKPNGKALIDRLNALKQENLDFIITFQYAEHLGVPMKNYNITPNVATLHYPKNFHRQATLLYPGLTVPLIGRVSFIALAHELTHCLHIFEKKLDKSLPFSTGPKSLLFQLYDRGSYADPEELWTIESTTGFSENILREEHRLPLRGGHLSAKFYDDYYRLIKIGFLAKIRMGEKNFQHMYFPVDFKLPMFLNTLEIKLPPNLEHESIYDKKDVKKAPTYFSSCSLI